MHECLRTNLDKISDACRKEEISLSVLQASNTELMPNIANACKVRLLPRSSSQPGQPQPQNADMALSQMLCQDPLLGQVDGVRCWEGDEHLQLCRSDITQHACSDQQSGHIYSK